LSTIARGADGGAVERQPDGFLGEEHQGWPPALGRTNSYEQCDGDALGVLKPGDEADDRPVAHRSGLSATAP
jgi:hypothetical protein